jgi:hypothetical protein
MDPLRGLSLQISSCSSLHRPIGAPNTSSYFMKNVGEKRESLSFYCLDRPLYIENMALRAMFSLSLPEQVQSTHEHSLYSMISMPPSHWLSRRLYIYRLWLRPPSQQISSCSSLHELIGAFNTGGKHSLIIWRMPRTVAIYIDCGATSSVFFAYTTELLETLYS